jgi:hypothetical protein
MGCRHRIACYERPRAQDIAAPEPPISAARRAVIKSLGTVGDPRHDRAGGRPDWYVYASPALGVIARFCRDETCRSFMTLRIWRADVWCCSTG